MHEELKKRVFEANLLLVKYGLVILTWGNVSGIDRENGVIAIKPSGVDYDKMTADDIVLTDLEGNPLENGKRPSTDLPTHVELYKAFSDIGGVVHTHSTFATAFSQAGTEIAPFGTTHADTFYGAVPVTRALKDGEIASEYEKNTGKVITELFSERKISPNEIPAALVLSHAPFTWGKTPEKAVENAYILEQTAKMAYLTLQLSAKAEDGGLSPVSQTLLDKHFLRKHGANAYYGQ